MIIFLAGLKGKSNLLDFLGVFEISIPLESNLGKKMSEQRNLRNEVIALLAFHEDPAKHPTKRQCEHFEQDLPPRYFDVSSQPDHQELLLPLGDQMRPIYHSPL
jgi:hypothetical protein